MKTVVALVGTRPEGIKMAPVVSALAEAPGLRPVLVSTGQHREMLRQVLDLFELAPERDLDLMRPDQTLSDFAARALSAVDALLAELEPDYLLVQGDTTSAMIGALAAFHRRVPVGHVEAGLRTGDMWSPWPEEGNRRMVGALADLHFAPTEGSRANLLREGVPAARVLVTGNTVVDALLQELERQREPGLRADLDRRIAGALGDGWRERPYVLVTGHRRESFGRGFDEICAALRELSERFPTHDFVYPVHLNPNVQAPVRAALEGRANVRLVAPQAYREFVALMEGAALVLTDSGGIQEEAPSLGKPVLVMRDTTERPEGVEAGTVRLVGPHRGRIVDAVTELLADPAAHARMATAANPYGDGRASARIAAALADRLAGRRAA